MTGVGKVATATIEMEQPVVARAVPIAAGLVVFMAGVLQFTKWKAHHLDCFREASSCALMTFIRGDSSRSWMRYALTIRRQ